MSPSGVRPRARDATRLALAAGCSRCCSSCSCSRGAERSPAGWRRIRACPAEARGVYAEVARRLLQGDGLRLGALLIANAGVVLLLWRRKLPADAAGALLVGLTLLDLGNVDRRMVAPQRTWPACRRASHPRRRQPVQRHSARPVARGTRPREGAAPVRILAPGTRDS